MPYLIELDKRIVAVVFEEKAAANEWEYEITVVPDWYESRTITQLFTYIRSRECPTEEAIKAAVLKEYADYLQKIISQKAIDKIILENSEKVLHIRLKRIQNKL